MQCPTPPPTPMEAIVISPNPDEDRGDIGLLQSPTPIGRLTLSRDVSGLRGNMSVEMEDSNTGSVYSPSPPRSLLSRLREDSPGQQ